MIFDIDDICDLEEEYKFKLEEKDKEIERLNNIINKFEQWIEDSKRETLMGLATINTIFFADELLNKLKELKGE